MSNEEQNQMNNINGNNINNAEENTAEIDEDIDDGEDHRPSYKKKRVIVPAITAVIFFLAGIYFMIHSIYYQSTDDAFVEGHIVSIAPRVSGPVEQMLIDDNMPVKKGQLLIVIDPNDYESLQYFQRVLQKSGIIDGLREQGCQEGDTVSIYDMEFDFVN